MDQELYQSRRRDWRKAKALPYSHEARFHTLMWALRGREWRFALALSKSLDSDVRDRLASSFLKEAVKPLLAPLMGQVGAGYVDILRYLKPQGSEAEEILSEIADLARRTLRARRPRAPARKARLCLAALSGMKLHPHTGVTDDLRVITRFVGAFIEDEGETLDPFGTCLATGGVHPDCVSDMLLAAPDALVSWAGTDTYRIRVLLDACLKMRAPESRRARIAALAGVASHCLPVDTLAARLHHAPEAGVKDFAAHFPFREIEDPSPVFDVLSQRGLLTPTMIRHISAQPIICSPACSAATPDFSF